MGEQSAVGPQSVESVRRIKAHVTVTWAWFEAQHVCGSRSTSRAVDVPSEPEMASGIRGARAADVHCRSMYGLSPLHVGTTCKAIRKILGIFGYTCPPCAAHVV